MSKLQGLVQEFRTLEEETHNELRTVVNAATHAEKEAAESEARRLADERRKADAEREAVMAYLYAHGVISGRGGPFRGGSKKQSHKRKKTIKIQEESSFW